MMGVYIKGMEMPDYGYVCLKVFANGEVLMTKEHRGALVITGIKDKVGTAVPVPEHGRLIDADELLTNKSMDIIGKGMIFGGQYVFSESEIVNAPTIIQASEEVYNEEVYDKYTDTAGNLHWTGTHSGEHIIQLKEGK